jgi:hypothetical protein
LTESSNPLTLAYCISTDTRGNSQSIKAAVKSRFSRQNLCAVFVILHKDLYVYSNFRLSFSDKLFFVMACSEIAFTPQQNVEFEILGTLYSFVEVGCSC